MGGYLPNQKTYLPSNLPYETLNLMEALVNAMQVVRTLWVRTTASKACGARGGFRTARLLYYWVLQGAWGVWGFGAWGLGFWIGLLPFIMQVL